MAWTDVVTRATGFVVAATQWNELVNNFKAIGDPWTSYTPVWTAASVNPTLGNGTITGAYMQAGKLVWGRVKVTVGSTTAVGTGAYRWSLPVTAKNSADDCIGAALYLDASGSKYSATCGLVTATTFGAWQNSGSLAAASPVVPANNDIYTFEFFYEAA